MDPKQYLLNQGYNEEEAAALLADAKASKLIQNTIKAEADAAAKLEEAKAADEQMKKFWNEEATPKLLAADRSVAKERAEAARVKTYLKSLKDAGYDVPADMIEGASPNPPEDPMTKPFTRGEAKQEFDKTAPTLVSLMSLSNEYQDLYGQPYLAGDTDFAEAQAKRTPFRDYVRQKYAFDVKKSERETKKQNDLIEQKVAEKVQAKEKELQERYGSNPLTRVPVPSRFAELTKSENKDSWKTQAGRDAARADRLNRFANLKVQ